MIDVGLRLALCAGLAAALGGAVLAFGHHERNVGRAEVRALWDADKAAQRQAVITDQAQALAESHRRISALQEIVHDTTAQLDRARADADAAGRARDGLRQQQARYLAAVRASGAASGATPADGGPTAASAADLFADLFGRADEAAGILAAALDGAHASGVACERAADSVTPPH